MATVDGVDEVVGAQTWSYSHCLYQLRKPFEHKLADANYLLTLSPSQIEEFLSDMLATCNTIEQDLRDQSIGLRPNYVFVQRFDLPYEYPNVQRESQCPTGETAGYNEYPLFEKYRQYIRSSAVIVFEHLENFELIKRYLDLYKRPLSLVTHPLTGDTLWHLNPYMIEMMHARITNLLNYRGESPHDRLLQADIFDFPIVGTFPLDVDNSWNSQHRNQVEYKLITTLCGGNEDKAAQILNYTRCRMLKRFTK